MKHGSFKSKNRPFTYSQIVRITGNFRTIVGEGGFGKVYLGTLNDNTPVAVKLLSPSSKQGFKEFRAEVRELQPKFYPMLKLALYIIATKNSFGYDEEPF